MAGVAVMAAVVASVAGVAGAVVGAASVADVAARVVEHLPIVGRFMPGGSRVRFNRQRDIRRTPLGRALVQRAARRRSRRRVAPRARGGERR